MRFFANMWVFDVEAVVVGADVVDGDFPCLFARLTVAPPCFERFKFAFLNWIGFGVGFYTFGQLVLVVPNFFGGVGLVGSAFVKKHNIGGNGGVGLKHGVRQTNNGV